jgi:PAS domain S-box-containing protein
MAKKITNDKSVLVTLTKQIAIQKAEISKLNSELILARKELVFQDKEKGKRAAELGVAKIELAFQDKEKGKRAAELGIANIELAFQDEEKGKRAAELLIADIELEFQNKEKEKRKIENKELEASSYSANLASQYSRSLIEASLDPLFTINPEGKITDMNNASVKVTGVSRENLIGTDFFDYFTEPDKAREGYQQVFAKGFVADYPLTIKDHKLTDVLFNGSVYKDENGKVLGIVVVARDITEQKRLEREMTEAKVFAELATAIAEEAKLDAESATRVAKDAVKAKQQFLSNMSHEIRTPMNAIIGFTKVVLKTELSAKQKEYLTAIKISGDALIVLINDILDLAKVDAGKMTFEKIPFKLAASISAMLHLFEPKIQEKNLELVKEYDTKIPEVLIGDPVRLHQIILNLVSNAVKFTSKGKITVGARLCSEDEENATIEFSISDTGIGISENKMETIFENFQQASSSTSRIFGGTGLGLAIVKQLVEQQSGKITVTSTVDEGSTFSFKLKFQKTKVEAEVETEMLELDTEIKNIKVLVVEDIALNQLLMKTLLDDFGFDRDIASNGKIAIEKLQLKTYDIILMDLQMPEMNGFEATEHIRKIMNSKIPIIALTADVTTVDLAKCKAVGMNDYIAKPVDERLLYSKIVSLVKKPLSEKFKGVPESEVSNKLKCIDLEYLNRRTKSNPDLMMEMITLYLEQTPPLVNSMKQSFQDKDWNLLQSSVHKMIPSFAIMGIHNDFETMAKKVQEYASTQKETEAIHDLVLKIESICNQACKELEEEFNTIKNTKK